MFLRKKEENYKCCSDLGKNKGKKHLKFQVYLCVPTWHL